MKKSLFLVVALFALASLMAAMAYSSATVTNDMSVKLTDTTEALLALEASEDHNAAFYGGHPSNAKRLGIDLSKGNGDASFGIQVESEYIWNELFKITNNSEHTVEVTVEMEQKVNNGRVSIFAGSNDLSWVRLTNRHEVSPGGTLTFDLEPGGEKWIDMKAQGHGAAKVNESDFSLIVSAEKK